MALSDRTASREQLLAAEERARARRESLERAAAAQAARASDLREWTDDNGTRWDYVVLDGCSIRIERCFTREACLRIPDVIANMPVVAIGLDALSQLETLEELVCPDAVVSIDLCAFRRNGQLRRVVLPASLAEFDSGWFQGCTRLAHLELPGELARVDTCVFDLPALKTLVIGPGTCEVSPGAFANSGLERIEIAADNPVLASDGRGIYSIDGSFFAALAVPAEGYVVREGCRFIARKAFSHFACLREVGLPEGIEAVGAYAFSRTGVVEFRAPSSLVEIGERAFFACRDLATVTLNEGLRAIGVHAFTDTAVGELRVPSSIQRIGYPLADRTAVRFSGEDASFTIAKGSERLRVDVSGGLYDLGAAEGDGQRAEKTLVCMLEPSLREYRVEPGTTHIAERAFYGHKAIEDVAFPEGLREVGAAAFKGCGRLRRAQAEAGLERIGDEAFLDTRLESFHVPASLTAIGTNALVTTSARKEAAEPTLRRVTVDAANPRFFVLPGLLMERKITGTQRIVLCTGGVEVLRIPEEVNSIASYAFSGVRGIRELHLSERIRTVDMRGLAVGERIERLVIELEKPARGRTHVTVEFPDSDRGEQQMKLAFVTADEVSAEKILSHYDTAIITASSFDSRSDGKRLSMSEQARLMVARLTDPVFMTRVNRELCDRVLRDNIEDICLSLAKCDDKQTIEALCDLGYVNGENICEIIDCVGVVQDASVTSFLLEMKRARFEKDVFDFDL